MADESVLTNETKTNTFKVYSAMLGVLLLVNFSVETGITLLENTTHRWLYPIFPFTRVGLLVITVMITNAYIRGREHKPKQRLGWRILRPILLILIVYGLAMGAWLSVSQADADRAQSELEKSSDSVHSLPKPTKVDLNSTNGTN